MRNIELLQDAFSGCTVRDGVVHLSGSFTDMEMKDIYMWFTEDLLNWNIPHYRIIGFVHSWDSSHQRTAFRRHDAYEQSIIELGIATKDIIPNRIGGNNPEKGCFYGVSEEVENHPKFNRAYGIGPTADSRRANVLMCSKDEIGSLMIDNEFDNKPIRELTSDNAWFTQFSKVEQPDMPKYLIRNKHISNIAGSNDDGTGDLSANTIFLIKEGTGRLHYDEAKKLVVPGWTAFTPCDVAYDLSRYFTVKYPNAGDSTLTLTYWEDLDEDVLTEILRNYGRRL